MIFCANCGNEIEEPYAYVFDKNNLKDKTYCEDCITDAYRALHLYFMGPLAELFKDWADKSIEELPVRQDGNVFDNSDFLWENIEC